MSKPTLLELEDDRWVYRNCGDFFVTQTGQGMCGSISSRDFWTTTRIVAWWTEGDIWFTTETGSNYRLEYHSNEY